MQEIEIKGLEEKIYYDTCENGLPVYMWVNEKVNSFYITLSVKYGSIHTEFKKEKNKAYIEGFGYVAPSKTKIIIVDSDGDINKMVGTME